MSRSFTDLTHAGLTPPDISAFADGRNPHMYYELQQHINPRLCFLFEQSFPALPGVDEYVTRVRFVIHARARSLTGPKTTI